MASHEIRGASNHRHLDCLVYNLFGLTTKEALPVNLFCEEDLSVTSGFSSQKASDAESVSMPWRHEHEWVSLDTEKCSLVATRLDLREHQFNTLRPRKSCRHFTDDISKCIFLSGNLWISLQISLKFVPNVRINNIPALVQMMAWCRPSDKPLFEPMLVSLLTHICYSAPMRWCNDETY